MTSPNNDSSFFTLNIDLDWDVECTNTVTCNNASSTPELSFSITDSLDFEEDTLEITQTMNHQETVQDVPISKYAKQTLIGTGGVGKVWRVLDHTLNRTVAVKTLHEELASQSEQLENFIIEAQIGAQLQHPGVVPIYEVSEESEETFFTMREVVGEELDVYVKDFDAKKHSNIWEQSSSGWHIRKFIQVIIQVCQTLEYVHQRGVIHRDIKPQNIMIGEFGEVLVVDWGMAKVGTWGSSRTSAHPIHVPITTAQLRARIDCISGTPMYMPPEQINTSYLSQDHRCDIYALGVMLFKILLGCSPFEGDYNQIFETKLSHPSNTFEHCIQLLRESGSLNEDRLHSVPKALIQILSKALMSNKDERYQSTAALAADLQEWLDGADKRQRALDALEEVRNYEQTRKSILGKAKFNREMAIQTLEETGNATETWHYIEAIHRSLAHVKEYNFNVKQTLMTAMVNAPDMTEIHEQMMKIEYKEYLRLLLSGAQEQLLLLERKIEMHLNHLPIQKRSIWERRFDKSVLFTKLVRRKHGPLVGRVDEKLSLYPLYANHPLITIVGDTGTGKTHLMLQTLVDHIADHDKSIGFCDISSTVNEYCVAQQVMSALSLTSQSEDVWTDLGHQLAGMGSVILAFDNAECNITLLQELIPPLLEEVPNLTLVLTSHRALDLPQEAVIHLDSMCTVDGMILFHQRATQADPDFTFYDGDLQRMLELVQVFDGVPMAIQSIARKVKHYSLSRLHSMVLHQSSPTQTSGLDTALTLHWNAFPEMAKHTIMQLLWFNRLFKLEVANACIDTAPFSEYTTPLDAIKFLMDEQWMVKARLCHGVFYHVHSSVRAFVEENTKDHPEYAALKGGFIGRLGEYYLQKIDQSTPESLLTLIQAELENMLLVVTDGPLEAASRVAEVLMPYFETYGPKNRGEVMMEILQNRQAPE